MSTSELVAPQQTPTMRGTRFNRSLSAASHLNPSVQFLMEARKALHKQIPFIAAPGMASRSNTVVRNFSLNNLAALNQLQGDEVSEKTRITGLSADDLKMLDDQVRDSEVVTAPLLLAVMVAVIAQFLNGYNTGVMNAPEAVVFPGHTVMEWSLAVSAFAIGGPFGALAGGVLSNRNGRRGALLICSWIFFFGGTMLSLAPNITYLVLARLVIGFASGFSSVLVPIYLGELAPPILRGTFGTCTQFSMVIGILMSDVFAFPLANDKGWRYLFAVTALLALVQLMLSPYLLESPRWLLSRDPHSQEARTVIKKLNGLRDEKEVQNEIENILDAHSLSTHASGGNDTSNFGGAIGDLIADKRVRLLLLCCLVMHVSQQLCGINAVFYYSTMFFEGTISDPLLGTTIVAMVNVLATWLAQILMDRCYRKTLLLWSSGGMLMSVLFLTLALMGIVPQMISLMSVMGFVFFFEIGLGPIPWLIVAEMFESKYVDPAQSVACQVNWICNFIIGVAFPSLNATLGVWTFVPFGAVLFACFAFTACYLPETLHRTVEELQQLIHGPEVQFHCEIEPGYYDGAETAYTNRQDQTLNPLTITTLPPMHSTRTTAPYPTKGILRH